MDHRHRLGLWLLMGVAAAAAAEVPSDAYIEQAMRAHGAPGLALVFVKDGQVVTRGYGTTGAGTGERVDERTLFQLGSCTKSVTGVAAAALVGTGRLQWDEPARKTLPDFQLSDPAVSSQLTLRDLLTARSGLSDGQHNERTWYGAMLSPAELLARLRHLPLQARFRDTFDAMTENYVIAGEVIARAGGSSYPEVVRRHLFEPIGMRDAFFDWPRRPVAAKRALPHMLVGGRLQTLPDRSFAGIDAAGTLVVHAADLAKWIGFLIAGGSVGGRQVVAAETLAQALSPQVVFPPAFGSLYPASPLVSFGLGFVVASHAGAQVVDALGNFYGMTCLITVIPSVRAGFAVLINAHDQLPLAAALKMRVLDGLFGTGSKDWAAAFLKPSAAAQAGGAGLPPRQPGTRPSLALPAYAGRYAHPAFGPLKVAYQSGELSLELNEIFVGRLEHWHFDTFRLRWSTTHGERPDEIATFTVDHEGRPAAVNLVGFAQFVR